MESVFGYVSVLPGAFSAYRWKAVRGEPLNSYFFVEENSVKEMGPFLANMYLAEDRVLCFELLAKENRTWTLHFVTGAVAETDVPETLLELLKQRRRWLNGSFFSLVYFVSKFHHLLSRSDHSWFRRLGLVVQFFYQLSSLIMSWFAVGSLYLSLVVIFNLALERLGDEASTQIMWVFSLSYGFLTFLQLMLGLGSKPHEVIKIYFMCSLGYGLIMSFASALSAWHLASGAYVDPQSLDCLMACILTVGFAVCCQVFVVDSVCVNGVVLVLPPVLPPPRRNVDDDRRIPAVSVHVTNVRQHVLHLLLLQHARHFVGHQRGQPRPSSHSNPSSRWSRESTRSWRASSIHQWHGREGSWGPQPR
jgi:Chitin synthase